MLKERLESYKKLEELRKSKLIVYVTGDRPSAETSIAADSLPPFVNHLDLLGDVDKISLFLYSTGGSILAGWSLVNLIRSFCKDFEIIVPFRCQSTATLMCLGANRIVMTKQGTLGPIDPSTNGLMNPQIVFNGQNIRVPVSVEQVNGFVEMAKSLGITQPDNLKEIYLKLMDQIHALSLGDVFRTRSQIKMLAEKLLKHHKIDPKNVEKVINFLCSQSGSHDYTIYRKEAKEDLGLEIEKPNDELYEVIRGVYQDIESEMDLRSPFNPNILLATKNPFTYSLRRVLIETIQGGCDVFLSEGTLTKQALPNGQSALQDLRSFEGWKHEVPPPSTPLTTPVPVPLVQATPQPNATK